MDNHLDKFGSFGKHEYSAGNFVQHNIKFNYFNYLLAVFKEDYEKHKMTTWWLGHIFGIGGIVFSMLDMLSVKDMIEAMPSGYRFSIWFFSILYALFQSLRAYERWRSDRYDNEIKKLDIKDRKTNSKIIKQ